MPNIIKSLFQYKGISTRKHYWKFMISMLICLFALGLVIGTMEVNVDSLFFTVFFTALNFVILPAMIIRRLRDAGYSPWWAVCAFLPFINWLSLIVIGCLKSVDIHCIEAEIVK